MMYPWAMLVLGLTIGAALMKFFAKRREQRIRAELIALIDAVVRDTELYRTRALDLAIARAWKAVRE